MPKAEFLKTEEGRYERGVKQEAREVRREEKGGDKNSLEGLDREKPVSKETPPDLHLDAEKGGDKVRIGGSKQPGQRPPQQSKSTRSESKPERAGKYLASLLYPSFRLISPTGFWLIQCRLSSSFCVFFSPFFFQTSTTWIGATAHVRGRLAWWPSVRVGIFLTVSVACFDGLRAMR